MEILKLLFLTLTSVMLQTHGLEIDDCFEISEPTVCYHCDSQYDPYCADTFRYSHYYTSKDVYLTECQGCCIKIVHPSYENTPRRILRSCTETLPQLNFTLDHNCDSFGDNERKICLCQKSLCNHTSAQVTESKLVMIIGAIIITQIRRISYYF